MRRATYKTHALITRLNTERLSRGWTYAETARRVNLDFNRIHRALVYGRFSPQTVKAIADALGVDLREYITEVGESRPERSVAAPR